MNKLPATRTLTFVAITLMACACRVFSQSPVVEVEGVSQTAINETIPPSIQSDLETYSSEKYSFNYPNGYTITLPTQSFPALTIEKARNIRIMRGVDPALDAEAIRIINSLPDFKPGKQRGKAVLAQ